MARPFRAVQLRVADFANVADQVRGDTVFGIEPKLRFDEFHLREHQVVARRFDEGQLAGRQLLFNGNREIAGTTLKAADARLEILNVQVKPASDRFHVFVAQALA